MIKFLSALVAALALFFVSTTSVSAALFINEFASDTAGTTADPDWVEIYNSGLDSVDLSLYRLRDNTTNVKDLSGTINAGSFAMVDWTNRLDKAGDVIRLLLIADESTPIDRVGYGNAGADVAAPGIGQSAGRSVDGAGQWTVFSNPTKGSANIVNQTFVLAWGNNLVGLTADKGTGYFAEDFARDLGNKVVSVTRWDSSRGRYITHIVGSTENNFPVVLGEGYFVRTNGVVTVTISGSIPIISSMTIAKGLSMISFPRAMTGVINTEELLQAFQAQGIDVRQIMRWYGGRWQPYMAGGLPFPITPGEGYMIRNYNYNQAGTFTLP